MERRFQALYKGFMQEYPLLPLEENATNLNPDSFYTREEMIKKKSKIDKVYYF